MALGRRGFLTASGAVATGGFLHAASAKASSHPVAELGIIPDTGDDLSEAFQKAIAKLSEAGQTVYLPGGTYNLHDVALPKKCVILGVPGQTRLVVSGRQNVFSAHDVETLFLSGLIVEGSAIAGNVREATIENLHVTLAENPNQKRCRQNQNHLPRWCRTDQRAEELQRYFRSKLYICIQRQVRRHLFA